VGVLSAGEEAIKRENSRAAESDLGLGGGECPVFTSKSWGGEHRRLSELKMEGSGRNAR